MFPFRVHDWARAERLDCEALLLVAHQCQVPSAECQVPSEFDNTKIHTCINKCMNQKRNLTLHFCCKTLHLNAAVHSTVAFHYELTKLVATFTEQMVVSGRPSKRHLAALSDVSPCGALVYTKKSLKNH